MSLNLNEALVAGFELHDENERRDSGLLSVKNHSPTRSRSLSDIGLPSVLLSSPSRDSKRRTWRDDSSIDKSLTALQKTDSLVHGLTLKMPPRELKQPNEFTVISPNFEKYTTNMLPRRSRGMDYSRAATNLHHSTLADKSSPDSSPTAAGKAMNIPYKTTGLNIGSSDFLHNNSSFWSTSGSIDQMNLSSSLGSINMMGSDSSESCSDEDDFMDDIDDSILTTPFCDLNQNALGEHWSGQSPSNCSPINFQQKSKKNLKKRKNLNFEGLKTKLSLSTKSAAHVCANDVARGPQTPLVTRHKRRESISWAANQLRISGNENDERAPKYSFENVDSPLITPSRDGQRGVIRRPVTRRGNMLPKTKGFARIQAALAEESTPVETEVLREATVVRQTRESDIEFEPRQNFGITPVSPTLGLGSQRLMKSLREDDTAPHPSSVPSNFKEKVLLNLKSTGFWENLGGDSIHHTPLLQTFPRTPVCGVGSDMSSDFPLNGTMHPFSNDSTSPQQSSTSRPATPQPGGTPIAVDITQKLSKKRLRDDDFDLCSFKRRAVSPGMSVHNSPIIKSPMQRDHTAWGSRPTTSSCNTGEPGKSPVNATQKRIGLQGMIDTNDSLMKMSIE